MEDEKIMVTIQEAADRTGLSYYSLRKLCLANRIVYIRSGSKFYINYPRLLDFLNECHADQEDNWR